MHYFRFYLSKTHHWNFLISVPYSSSNLSFRLYLILSLLLFYLYYLFGTSIYHYYLSVNQLLNLFTFWCWNLWLFLSLLDFLILFSLLFNFYYLFGTSIYHIYVSINQLLIFLTFQCWILYFSFSLLLYFFFSLLLFNLYFTSFYQDLLLFLS